MVNALSMVRDYPANLGKMPTSANAFPPRHRQDRRGAFRQRRLPRGSPWGRLGGAGPCRHGDAVGAGPSGHARPDQVAVHLLGAADHAPALRVAQEAFDRAAVVAQAAPDREELPAAVAERLDRRDLGRRTAQQGRRIAFEEPGKCPHGAPMAAFHRHAHVREARLHRRLCRDRLSAAHACARPGQRVLQQGRRQVRGRQRVTGARESTDRRQDLEPFAGLAEDGRHWYRPIAELDRPGGDAAVAELVVRRAAVPARTARRVQEGRDALGGQRGHLGHHQRPARLPCQRDVELRARQAVARAGRLRRGQEAGDVGAAVRFRDRRGAQRARQQCRKDLRFQFWGRMHMHRPDQGPLRDHRQDKARVLRPRRQALQCRDPPPRRGSLLGVGEHVPNALSDQGLPRGVWEGRRCVVLGRLRRDVGDCECGEMGGDVGVGLHAHRITGVQTGERLPKFKELWQSFISLQLHLLRLFRVKFEQGPFFAVCLVRKPPMESQFRSVRLTSTLI